MRLEHKVALITGGMSGIGRGIASRFAEEGADIAIHDIVTASSDYTPQTPEVVRAQGRRCEIYQVDVSRADQARTAVARTIRDFGRIHILVNDAGTNILRPTFDFSDEEWERVIGVNLTGTWNYCRYLGPHLVERGGGSIVNVASVGSFQASYSRAPYMASKGGVAMLTKALALDLAEGNVRVNAVAPGSVLTPMARRASQVELGERIRETMFRALTPMRRRGKPEEIANAALFLASDEASFVTGHILIVDGGMMAGNQIGARWRVADDAELPWLPGPEPSAQ